MSNEQLDEFERFFNAQDDVGAFQWLETNFPNYKEIVTEEFAKLKKEIAVAEGDVTAHIFICYSHNDRDIAEQLVQKFQSVGIRVWVDHIHVTVGNPNWEREIRQNIKKSNGVVYIATEEAATSGVVCDELAIARDHNIPVYAIWVRGEFWNDCIPLGWGRTHYVDGRKDDLGDKFDGAVLSLIASLKKARGAS